MDRAMAVAMLARRYTVLADRPALSEPDRDARIDRTLGLDAYDRPLLDMAQVVGADDLDLMCGQAVRVLRKHCRADVLEVFEILGALDPERLLGIAFALPADTRESIRQRNAVWGWWIQQVDAEMPAACAAVADLLTANATQVQKACALIDMNDLKPREDLEARAAPAA